MDAIALGQYLRESRETNEIELDDAVAKLRIRRPILESFEAGEFAAAGLSDIQARGMLRNYARHLELDEEQVLRFYDEARYGQTKRRRQDDPRVIADPLAAVDLAENRAARRRGLLRGFILLLVSLAAIAIIVFVTSQLIDSETDDALLDESLRPEFIADAPPTVAPTPSPAMTSAPPTPTSSNRASYSGSGVLASIQVNQRTWLRVSADAVEQFVGIAAPDTLLEYAAIGEITLTASNAMALDIMWNGQQQGQFGGRGQQVDITFTVDAVDYRPGAWAAPSPGFSPTPLPSALADASPAPFTPTEASPPSPSPTATSSSSPVPTAAPTASDTPTITLTPTETAILPPRVTQAGLIPTKEGA